MIRKVLIANRGEIAVRVIRALRECGMESVAVYSMADRNALHVKLADQSVCIGPADPKDSYLNMEQVIMAALNTGCDAVHPGYGFLSENNSFSKLCADHQLIFIGPNPQLLHACGDKIQAKKTMKEAGIPVIPGFEEPADPLAAAVTLGFPLMIKAAAGGGGKGLRKCERKEEFLQAYDEAKRETENAFGQDTLFIEKCVEHARHIEAQIAADRFGNVVCVGLRNCSLQKYHQKVVEETETGLSKETEERIKQTAINVTKAYAYMGVGTVEFIVNEKEEFWFLEINPRIQVEHGITELVSGIDLVKEQIRIFNGQKLTFLQEEIRTNGCAIECRINALTPGKIHFLHLPGGNGVRVDTALYQGYEVPSMYDALIVKVMTYADTRKHAIQKMRMALSETVIDGIRTNIDDIYQILYEQEFADLCYTTESLENWGYIS